MRTREGGKEEGQLVKYSFKKKKWRPPSKKKKGGKTKPEEQGGTPQHQHCPRAKRREDRNPKYHEEQHE
jgi:hypothetical protein